MLEDVVFVLLMIIPRSKIIVVGKQDFLLREQSIPDICHLETTLLCGDILHTRNMKKIGMCTIYGCIVPCCTVLSHFCWFVAIYAVLLRFESLYCIFPILIGGGAISAEQKSEEWGEKDRQSCALVVQNINSSPNTLSKSHFKRQFIISNVTNHNSLVRIILVM